MITVARRHSFRAIAVAAACVATAPFAQADEPIKVGVALDISGPFAGPGAEIRDGLNLAAKLLNNKLGGVPAEFIQADTAGNPETARQVADRFIKREKVDFFTGPVGSNVVLAVGPTVFGAKVPFLSANPGPSQLAGKQCNPYFFGTSYQNDAMHEAAGKHAADKGYKKVAVLAPNYPAGKDAVNGFKRAYGQAVSDEVYTKVGQLDFAAELAQLRSAKPEAVYIFQPGGMGINFIKQFMGAGLNKDMVLISSPFTADQDIIAAVGEPMVGIYNASSYAHDLDNAANKQFVAEFQKAYGRLPTLYAAFAYDVIMNMDAAVKATGGKVTDKAALAKAVKSAKFNSVRGNVSYGSNQFLTQDYYLRQVVKTADGKITNALQSGKIYTAHHDSYAAECSMP